MAQLLYLQWLDNNNSKKLLKAVPVQTGMDGAKKLLAKNKGNPYPTYIRMEDAAKFSLEVTVEDVKSPKTAQPAGEAVFTEAEVPKKKKRIISKEEADVMKEEESARSPEQDTQQDPEQ